MPYETKLAKLKRLMQAGDHRAAIKLAAGWRQLGEHRERITRGWAAYNNGSFYTSIGQDPAAHIQDAIAALKERYQL